MQTNAELQLYFCSGDCDEQHDEWAAVSVLLIASEHDAVVKNEALAEVLEVRGVGWGCWREAWVGGRPCATG
jgi:hypothetical protein